MKTVKNLLDEIRQLRSQLLSRIELLEDDVEVLMKENMEFSKYFYCFERDVNARIDRLDEKLSRLRNNEGQKGSKDTYQEGKEAP